MRDWDKWTKITVFAAFFEAWLFIAGTTALVAAAPKAQNTCSDSDGGNVITVFGIVSGKYKNKPYSYSDSCVDSGTIKEYYCNGVYQTSSQQSCGTDGYSGSNYCLNGSVYRNWRDNYCASGACGYTDTPTLQQACQYGCINGTCSQPGNSCNDTDGGYAVTIQGTVSGYQYGYPYSYTDSCNSTVILNEWHCSGTSPSSYQYYCTMNYTSCMNGACI